MRSRITEGEKTLSRRREEAQGSLRRRRLVNFTTCFLTCPDVCFCNMMTATSSSQPRNVDILATAPLPLPPQPICNHTWWPSFSVLTSSPPPLAPLIYALSQCFALFSLFLILDPSHLSYHSNVHPRSFSKTRRKALKHTKCILLVFRWKLSHNKMYNSASMGG